MIEQCQWPAILLVYDECMESQLRYINERRIANDDLYNSLYTQYSERKIAAGATAVSFGNTIKDYTTTYLKGVKSKKYWN